MRGINRRLNLLEIEFNEFSCPLSLVVYPAIPPRRSGDDDTWPNLVDLLGVEKGSSNSLHCKIALL